MKYLYLLSAAFFLLSNCGSVQIKNNDASRVIAKESAKRVENIKKDLNQYVQNDSAKKFINRELDDLKQNLEDLANQNYALNSAKDSVLAVNLDLTKTITELNLKVKAARNAANKNFLIGGVLALLIKLLLWFLFKFALPAAVTTVTDKIKEKIKAWFKTNVIDRVWKTNEPTKIIGAFENGSVK